MNRRTFISAATGAAIIAAVPAAAIATPEIIQNVDVSSFGTVLQVLAMNGNWITVKQFTSFRSILSVDGVDYK